MSVVPSRLTAEQALQDLAYAVSHDLGASARTIRAFSELLATRHGHDLDAEALGFLKRINQGAADLQAQLAGLLAYSRVVSHGQPFQAVDVGPIWQSIVDVAAERIQRAGAEIETGTLPIVLADPDQLRQVLQELLDNALKFRRDAPLHVRFTAGRRESTNGGTPEAEWLFRFADTGRGLTPPQNERLFRMFQRFCPEIPGVGAGLALVARIVQRHGGQIWGESEAGQGTTICFTWPMCVSGSETSRVMISRA